LVVHDTVGSWQADYLGRDRNAAPTHVPSGTVASRLVSRTALPAVAKTPPPDKRIARTHLISVARTMDQLEMPAALGKAVVEVALLPDSFLAGLAVRSNWLPDSFLAGLALRGLLLALW